MTRFNRLCYDLMGSTAGADVFRDLRRRERGSALSHLDGNKLAGTRANVGA